MGKCKEFQQKTTTRLHSPNAVVFSSNDDDVAYYIHYTVLTGMYEFSVETWRPIGRKMVDRLRRFFVGGTSELSDISYVTQPLDFEVGVLLCHWWNVHCHI